MFVRELFPKLLKRMREKRYFIQVLAGPRQVGKTTLAKQLIDSLPFPSHFASADALAFEDKQWIEQQWEVARTKLKKSDATEGLLVLDEVQKVPGWSEVVKLLWDQDSLSKRALKVIILGSSPLLLQRGLSESLAGRFEFTAVRHWSFREMRDAFNTSLYEYIFFGGYPGAMVLFKDEERWKRYIQDSLIETTLSRDILLMTQVNTQSSLPQLFIFTTQRVHACAITGHLSCHQ